MKLAIVLVCLSLAVMGVLVFQAVRQEIDLRNMKARVVKNTAEGKRKEEAIVELKQKIQQLRTTLTSVNGKLDELKKKKDDAIKLTETSEKSLQTCNSEKAENEKKKTSMAEALTKLKGDHTEAKKKAEEELQSLKQNILDRDKAICAFADATKDEARKLCGLPEAPK